MEWKDWEGKKVFIRTGHGKVYSGIVKEVNLDSLPLVWIIILDKFNQLVQLISSEIIQIKEESQWSITSSVLNVRNIKVMGNHEQMESMFV